MPAAHKDMAPVAKKKVQGLISEQPDPELQAESEAIAKNSGFKHFAEYDDVAANILMVVAGIDPLTKRYTAPQTAVKKWSRRSPPTRPSLRRNKKELLMEPP
jgi:hypothetical protein